MNANNEEDMVDTEVTLETPAAGPRIAAEPAEAEVVGKPHQASPNHGLLSEQYRLRPIKGFIVYGSTE